MARRKRKTAEDIAATQAEQQIDQSGFINFTKLRKPFTVVSTLLVILSITCIAVKQFNLGIDFTGGTVLEVAYDESADLDVIRQQLNAVGYDARVQLFGSSEEVLIRLNNRQSGSIKQSDISSQLIQALALRADQVRRVEFVGPQIGEELSTDGALAVLFALIGILIYVSVRFEYRFSLGAVLALVHDVTITLGIFSLFQLEFDLTVLAAILAVVGYSLNDTIVVFDRVRDNFIKVRKMESLDIMNISVNQTLTRTIVTSLTTLIVLFALFILGGAIIHNFALTLIVGVIVGTYSSIYIATSSVLFFGVNREHLIQSAKEGQDIDAEEAAQQARFLEREQQ